MSFLSSDEGTSQLSSLSRATIPNELPPGQMRLPTRVSKACERCRRHKSRCDDFRPCSICLRAGVECVSTAGARPRKKRRLQMDVPKAAESIVPEAAEEPRDNVDIHEDSTSVSNVRVTDRTAASSTSDEPRAIAGPAPALSTVDYREAESIMGFARKIFQSGSQNLDKLATSAIPDGETAADAANSGQATPQRLPIHSVLGCSLPPTDVMRMLLEEYFESIHWFSLVIYEPRFRLQFESIRDGNARTSQKPFLMLLSTVLGMAAWYYSKRPSPAYEETSVDWSNLASELIKHAEANLFEIVDESTLASVQTCILLASYNSYHGKPKAAFALLGATIKTAQAMGLHRESSRGGAEALEERARTWWTIYTWDRWASISYGRPLGINDKDCNVPMPSDVYEKRQFKMRVSGQDDELICYSAYQRELNKLYIISSPMIETIFGIRSSSNSAETTNGSIYRNMMKNVSWKLSEWRRSLPYHLVFDFDNDIALNASATHKAHQLQALSLQLTFDNLVIILHRPFLAQQVLGLAQGNLGTDHLSPSQNSPAISTNAHADLNSDKELPSLEQWWSAAIRTSRVTQLPQIARLATDGHLVAFLAMNLFNSAVVMVAYALSNPLSDRAQEAKRNITRISRLQELLGKRSKLSMQSSVVLRSMIYMIVQREAEAMLASIQQPREPGGDIGNDPETQASPYFSVEDALRLPLSTPADPANLRVGTAHQENSWPIGDETLRMNESLASLQRAFPGNDFVASQYSNDNSDGPLLQNYGQSMNVDMLDNNVPHFNFNNDSHKTNGFDGTGDDLYWIWNSIDGISTWSQ